MTEAETQVAIRLALGKMPKLKIWRNNCGEGWQGKSVVSDADTVILRNPRRVNFGVASPGGADLLGIKSVVVTPEMVGQTVGLFVSIEVKAPGGRPKPDQRNFLSVVRDLGGIADVAHSADEALQLVGAT